MTWIFDENGERQGKGISLLRWAHLAGETVGDAHWDVEDSPRSFGSADFKRTSSCTRFD